MALIIGNFSSGVRCDFVRTYFLLLAACLDRYVRGQDVLFLLRKIVGFEVIRVSGDQGGAAAAIASVRHPVYLLSKLANPRRPEDPKYLPLICPCTTGAEAIAMYWHYRRIPLVRTNGIQLFVYPPTQVGDRPLSHALIGQLFSSLTPRTDPWIRERSQSLFEGVFGSLVAGATSPRVQLLDMACGSAQVTMTLCRKAFTTHQKSFDLTLVDVVRGNRAIANTFFRNLNVFGNVAFRREDMFEWVDSNSDNPAVRFDIALLLRACNLFSRFSIAEMPLREVNALRNQDPRCDPIDIQTLRPAELIQRNLLSKIQQGIGRFVFNRGSTFRQFSCSDYFKAIHIVTGGILSGDSDTLYMPFRAFDEDILVLPSGRSLIARLVTMAKQLVIEDADLLPCHLERHFRRFALDDLSVTDLTGQARRRGAAVYLIEGRQDDAGTRSTEKTAGSMSAVAN